MVAWFLLVAVALGVMCLLVVALVRLWVRVERLSREFQLEAEVMLNYVTALRSEWTVVLGRTTRGSTVVRLAG